MNSWTMYRTYRRMMAAQWLDRERIVAIQDRKLRALIRRAYENVRYYRKLLDDAGVAPDTFRGLDDLSRIPITTRADLQNSPFDSIIDRTVDPSRLVAQLSSGSTGRPLRVFYDRSSQYIRNGLFLRALRTAGYRFGHKLLIVTVSTPRTRARGMLRWRHVSIEDPPERLLEHFLRFAPDYLYGPVTSLRLLAEQVAGTKGSARKLARIFTKSEMLDGPTRRLLQSTFHCDVFNFYGSSEMGMVGSECPAHRGYHLADDSVIVEQISMGAGAEFSRLVMTNLYSSAMPFIRFELGDLGVLDRDAKCECGRTFTLLNRLDGRAVDCVRLRDGRRISPYMLTCQLEKVQGVKRYQVIQTHIAALIVRVETGVRSHEMRTHDIREAIRAVVGDSMAIQIQMTEKLPTVPGRKFRAVECLLES